MTVQTTYPGVYIIERRSGTPAIPGVSTSRTAFVGAARRGVSDTPVPVRSFADYVRLFGDPIDEDRPLGHTVQQFFQNGGSDALVVRALGGGAAPATLELPAVDGLAVRFTARSRGTWADGVLDGGEPAGGVFVEVLAAEQNPEDRFTLEISEWAPGRAGAGPTRVTQERWAELSLSPGHLRYVETVLEASSLVRATVTGAPTSGPGNGTSTGSPIGAALTLGGQFLRLGIDQGTPEDHVLFPDESPPVPHDLDEIIAHINAPATAWPVVASEAAGSLVLSSPTAGLDSAVVVSVAGPGDASGALGLGAAHGGTEVAGSAPYRPAVAAPLPMDHGSDGGGVGPDEIVSATAGQGMLALSELDFPRFNILCLPGVTTADVAALSTALDHCRRERAFLVIDPQPGANPDQLRGAADLLRGVGAHGAVYWPRLRFPGIGSSGLGPSGAVAGIMARTDAARGIWKAPAGLDAGIAGILGLTTPTDDAISGVLNPRGINVLRTFPGAGTVIWGARTLAGTDLLQSDSKYIPVRRLTDHLASSIYLGTQFAVFAPNDPDLWAQLRLVVGSFLRGLFRQGAFQKSEARSESDSFFVICDATVNPPSEIDLGRVNVVVGFAPLKPAEFVLVTITQISQAGE